MGAMVPIMAWDGGENLSLAEEIEGFAKLLVGGCLVDQHIANGVEQGEIDDTRHVLLVVAHEVEQSGVVVARELRLSVVLAYEACRLMQPFGGEASFACTHIQLADQAEGYSIAMQQRSVPWCA